LSPRLLYVANSAKFFCTHRLRLAVEAARHGFDVHVAAPPAPEHATVRNAGLVTHEWEVTRSDVSVAGEARSVRNLIALYRRLKPLVTHHVAMKPILYGTIAARVTGVKCVVNAVTGLGYMFSSPSLRARIIRAAFAGAGRASLRHRNSVFIFQNPDDAEVFHRLKLALPNDSHIIRGSGVDPDVYAHAPEVGGPPRVLFASRMLWGKGVAEFVDAARILRGSGARFLLAGDPDPGNPESVQASDLERWQADGIVEWLGHREDMPRVLAETHVVVLPSRYGEGVPKALIEAAACGRPIVATDIPGCREIVVHGNNGFLVPVGRQAELCDAIGKLLSNPQLRVEMGSRGRDLVRAEFSLEHVIGRTIAVYDELVSRQAHTGTPA
jgi:glycosyltransferase involved in cell wall biosynthesis